MADEGFAAGLDDTGADEQMVFAEARIVHANRVVGEVVGLVADLGGQILPGRASVSGGHRSRRSGACCRDREACQLPLVLTRVIQINDLNRDGKMKTQRWTVAGVVGLGAMTGGFPAAADDSGDRSGTKIAQPGKLGSQEGTLSFQFRQGLGHEVPFCTYYIRSEEGHKKQNPQIVHSCVAHPSAPVTVRLSFL